MRVVRSGYEILTENMNGMEILKFIEKCGRVCYKSEDKITEDSCIKFVQRITQSGHHSVLEHASFTVKFNVSRSTSHQIVRHRIVALSQESQRYCDYSLGKFDGQVSFVHPAKLKEELPIDDNGNETMWGIWKRTMEYVEQSYMDLVKLGAAPQLAREVLTNSAKTEVVLTSNLREWRHIFSMRTSAGADDGVKSVMIPLLADVKKLIPVIYDDIIPYWEQK